jgi:hypothetical protein
VIVEALELQLGGERLVCFNEYSRYRRGSCVRKNIVAEEMGIKA